MEFVKNRTRLSDWTELNWRSLWEYCDWDLYLDLTDCTTHGLPSVPQTSCLHLIKSSGTPLHYSCLENPMDGGAWWAVVHGVAKSRTGLSDFTFTFHLHTLEKEMATHSRVLTWRIPGTREPGGLPSMGSCRVGHDWSDLAAAGAIAPLQSF